MADTLKSRIWVSDDLEYKFPEQSLKQFKDRPAIGVCLSGGGTRAMTAAMGQLRALDHLNVIKDLRYISCVSGGSWAASIYTYCREDIAEDCELLGPVTPAEKITDAHVDQDFPVKQLAHGATKSLKENIKNWAEHWWSWRRKVSPHNIWNFAVGETFLKDFDLFDKDIARSRPKEMPCFSFDTATVDEIKACNPKLKNKTFYTVREDRPFLIMNSCFLLPDKDPNAESLLNFEYTPLTVGRPHKCQRGEKYYGGGFIEPFAFYSGAPSQSPDKSLCSPDSSKLGSDGWVTCKTPNKTFFALAGATGTSSSAFAELAIKNLWTSEFDPLANYWAVKGKAPYFNQKRTLFGDGGLLENYGIIPLVQRGIELAIVFINTETKLDPDYSPNGDSSDKINDPNGLCDASLPALFGYSNKHWKWKYPTNKIFPSEELDPVLQALKCKQAKGEPMIVDCLHTVIDNSHWGVKRRDAKLRVIWCYLDRSTKWESKLASKTIRDEIVLGNRPIPTDRSGGFKNFPNYKTVWQNKYDLVQLTNKQVTLLADFACDCVLMGEEQTIFNAIIEAKEPQSSPPS